MENSLFPEPAQAGLEFPTALTEKYRPRVIEQFIGQSDAKRAFEGLLKRPRPCALLLCGPPGVGKTSMALAFASQLRAGLIHHASAKLTVEAVADTREKLNYYPESGGYWVVLCDEVDTMSRQAQMALLSCLDCASALRPKFGGGYEQGRQLPVIWIFTCNGTGEEQTDPPATLEPKFLSRCGKVKFPPVNGEMKGFLQTIWESETGRKLATGWNDASDWAQAANGSVRDALTAMEINILTA